MREVYKSVVDPESGRKWIICMENRDCPDAFSRHPAYLNNTDTTTTLSSDEAMALKAALDNSLKTKSTNCEWYLEWCNKNTDVFIGEVFFPDIDNATVKSWLNLTENVEMSNCRYTVNAALADELAKYTGYRIFQEALIPAPVVINLKKFDYWLYSNP